MYMSDDRIAVIVVQSVRSTITTDLRSTTYCQTGHYIAHKSAPQYKPQTAAHHRHSAPTCNGPWKSQNDRVKDAGER